jgi:hypothetical protein
MFALAAIPGFASGEDEFSTTYPPRSATVPASHPAPATDEAYPAVDASYAAQSPRSNFWLRGEYLAWWVKDARVPALITTGQAGATTLPGVLGQSDTNVLFGGNDMDNRFRSGGRFSAGLWLNCCQTIGLDASYFFLGSRSVGFAGASSGALGSPLIARPFFDVLTGTQNAQLVAFPALAGATNILAGTGTGLASGNIQASMYSRLQGGDINAFCCICSGCDYWAQALVGFRYMQLNEGIGVTESSVVNSALPAGSPFFGGSTISISDQFDTRNNFYGGQVGLRGELRTGRMFVEVQGKVALGVTNQVVDINGSTVITASNGVSTVTPAGFLASGSNSGRFTRNRFAVVPEAGINVGADITGHLRAFVGYTFMYWSSVVRPGDQIDVGLSGTQIPTDSRFNPQAGPARPGVLLQETDFWAHGLNVGLELHF